MPSYLGGALTRGANQPTPILQNGPETYDDFKVGPCAVVRVSATDWRMWYEAIDTAADPDGAGVDVYAGVGYATSSDGVTWTKQGRIITPLTTGWENYEVCPNSVVWDDQANEWVLFYHGGNNSQARDIGRMTSPNLTSGGTWTRYGSNPILSPGGAGAWDEQHLADMKVLKVGTNDWRAWYVGRRASDGAAQIGYASSSDGIAWTKSGSNPVLPFGASGQWDDADIHAVAVHRQSSTRYDLWYIGRETIPGGTTQVGHATSSDGIAWTRDPLNPVMGDAADDDATDSLEVLFDGSRLHVFYGQFDLVGQTLRGKGYAYRDAIDEPVQTTLIDDFNRADDANPPPGPDWTNGIITTVANEGIAIVSNQACRKSSGGYRQGGYYNVSQPGPDCDVVAEISAVGGTDGFTMYGRLKDLGSSTTVDGYAIVFELVSGSTYTPRLWRRENGTTTTLVSGSNVTLSAGDLFAITFRGSTIRIWHKPTGSAGWSLCATGTDSNITTAGYVGLEFLGNQNGKITNMWATTVSAGYSVTADPGAYTVTGIAASPLADRTITGATGTYLFTGTAASTLTDRTITASPGSYTLTGVAADLLGPGVMYTLTADPGSYTVTGTAAQTLAARLLSLDPSSYTLTGIDVQTLATRLITAAPAAYLITGPAATLSALAATIPGTVTVIDTTTGVTVAVIDTTGATVTITDATP